ncbi:MAG: hypothetical protein M3P33_04345 [bacterium]|nr:hypothetical protein [bacterium]
MSYQDDRKNKGGISSAIGAAVVGAAIGAAAAYLSDKTKRDELMNKAADVTNNTKDKAGEILSTVADKTGDALQDAGKKVKSSKSNSDYGFNSTSDSLEDMTTI